MTELPPACDFCDQTLSEDEELVPVWVGEPAQPSVERVQRTVEKPTDPHLRPVILGKRSSEWSALYRALKAADTVDVHMADRVHEPDAEASFTSEIDLKADGGGFSEGINTDKAAATVTVRPDSGHDTPDLEVCEFCAANFHDEESR